MAETLTARSRPGPFGMIAKFVASGEERAVAFLRWRGRTLYLTAGAGLAVIAVIAVIVGIVVGTASNGTVHEPVRLSAAPLGVNVAPWDSVYSSRASVAVIQPLLKAAGIRQLRYGGGSYADTYDWQANASIENCLPHDATAPLTARCASPDPLDFSQFSGQARAIGAQSFVTVNYGAGTPAEAAAWVAQAARAPGQDVALWEVGNETYGCWEVDNELAGPPNKYRGYQPTANGATANPTCPQVTEGSAAGTQTLASSYAANAAGFLRAMKAADPAARIGVPWAFDGSVQGAAVPDNSEWNTTVLRADGKYVSFVDAHYYPFSFAGSTGGSNPSDGQVLQALRQIPALYESIRAGLNAYDPSAFMVIGETAVSDSSTTTVCTPVGALFAAGDVLSWLAAGAQSVDWWDLNNYGNTGSRCAKPDYGFVTSSSSPATQTPYYGYLLASVLAQPHALLGALATSDPSAVLAFKSALPDGGVALALINISTAAVPAVTVNPSPALSGTLRTWTYSAGRQNPAESQIMTGTEPAASVASGITVPAESMIVLQTR
jgi:hypothetical protein